VHDFLCFFKGVFMITCVLCQTYELRQVGKQLVYERVIYKVEQYWNHRVENGITLLKYLLNESHVILCHSFLLVNDRSIDILNVLIVFGKFDLSLDGEDPLNHIVLTERAQDVLSVLLFYLEAKLLLRVVLKHVDARVAQHYQVEVLVL
jgi:hypothetical protein